MKKLAILFATVVCFAMISGSFAATNQNTENGIMVHKNYHDLRIIVKNNPSTGSYWRSVFDHSNVKMVSKTYFTFTPEQIGSGGYDLYVFRGEVGQKISLKHVDHDGKVFETKTYTIK